MKAWMTSFLDRVSGMMRPLSLILGLAGILTGLVIMGSCAASMGWSGALMGFGSLVVILIFVIFFVGSIYLLTRMSSDVQALRRQAESSQAPAADDQPSQPKG